MALWIPYLQWNPFWFQKLYRIVVVREYIYEDLVIKLQKRVSVCVTPFRHLMSKRHVCVCRGSRGGVCTCVCMYVYMCICMHACMCVCMYVCMHACMHACTYACMHLCMCVRTRAPMHACIVRTRLCTWLLVCVHDCPKFSYT